MKMLNPPIRGSAWDKLRTKQQQVVQSDREECTHNLFEYVRYDLLEYMGEVWYLILKDDR